MQKNAPITVTIDGPAASGKGTLARLLAQEYNLRHLDTGLLYRAVAAKLLESGECLTDVRAAQKLAEALDLTKLSEQPLKDDSIGAAASRIAVMPEVRSALLKKQRDFISSYKSQGVVLDGRDTGTVVYPEAAVKFFVVASLEERAQRRFAELMAAGRPVAFEALKRSLEQRDETDRSRASSPLSQAENSYLLDTTQKDIKTIFNEAKNFIEKYLSNY